MSLLGRLMGGGDIPEVDADEAKRRQDAGALVVDVREPDEWAAGHVVGALHIPLGTLSSRSQELPADRELLFICRSGNRSLTGAKQARSAGRDHVASIAGGTVAWIRHGLPVERG